MKSKNETRIIIRGIANDLDISPKAVAKALSVIRYDIGGDPQRVQVKPEQVEIDHPEPPTFVEANPRLDKALLKIDSLTSELEEISTPAMVDCDSRKDVVHDLKEIEKEVVEVAKLLDKISDALASARAELKVAEGK